MTDEVWRRDEIQSPCTRVCVIHPQARICTGCLRTIDEITDWSKYTDQERRDLIDALPSRQALLSKRRGGRSGAVRRKSPPQA